MKIKIKFYSYDYEPAVAIDDTGYFLNARDQMISVVSSEFFESPILTPERFLQRYGNRGRDLLKRAAGDLSIVGKDFKDFERQALGEK